VILTDCDQFSLYGLTPFFNKDSFVFFPFSIANPVFSPSPEISSNFSVLFLFYVLSLGRLASSELVLLNWSFFRGLRRFFFEIAAANEDPPVTSSRLVPFPFSRETYECFPLADLLELRSLAPFQPVCTTIRGAKFDWLTFDVIPHLHNSLTGPFLFFSSGFHPPIPLLHLSVLVPYRPTFRSHRTLSAFYFDPPLPSLRRNRASGTQRVLYSRKTPKFTA